MGCQKHHNEHGGVWIGCILFFFFSFLQKLEYSTVEHQSAGQPAVAGSCSVLHVGEFIAFSGNSPKHAASS